MNYNKGSLRAAFSILKNETNEAWQEHLAVAYNIKIKF